MKKISAILLIILLVAFLFSCETSDPDTSAEIPDGTVAMTGVVTDVGEKIAIIVTDEVYENEPIHVVINDNTSYVFSDGTNATKQSIKAGDRITIAYSGQMMLSYPGQIVAIKIIIK